MIRDSFVFYRSFYEGLSALNDADRLACYDAIAKYGLDGVADAEGVPAAVLALVKPILDANNRKVESGRKGGEANNKQSEAKPKQIEASKKQSEAKGKQTEANGKLNEKCEMRNVKGEIKKDSTRAREKPPTVEEVRSYCQERNNSVDPQRFVDYYEPQKWRKANGQPVADWKACVRTWEKGETKTSPRPKSFQNQRVYDYDALEKKLIAAGGAS